MESTTEQVCHELQKLTGKKHIALLPSGKQAIQAVMPFLKHTNKTQILIQDMGGLVSYRSIAHKEKFQVIELKTNYGLLNLADLQKKATPASALFVNSLSGFFAEQDVHAIAEACKTKGCLLVNDVSGSLGADIATTGDIIIGSFGKHRLVNILYGGFIASDEPNFTANFNSDYAERLLTRLTELPLRRAFLYTVSRNIKKELAFQHHIIHENVPGINVVVAYRSEEEKQQLIHYCERNAYPYMLCPRYIRVNENAISIEVKQLVRT